MSTDAFTLFTIEPVKITLVTFIIVAAISLLCEYMDASIGMGYGTTLTPVLLILGFSALAVVPTVLIGQLAGGFVGAFFHQKFGNVKLDFRQDERVKKRLRGLGYLPRSFDSKVVAILVISGVIGALVAVFFTINVPSLVLKTYIGVMVLLIGVIILIRRNRNINFSWKSLVSIGLISAFNKGATGGGYGPLVTGGQLISGREAKGTIGSTTLAEAIVCITPFVGYVIVGNIVWNLAAATSIGSILAAPFAAFTVKKITTNRLKLIIGLVTFLLGIYTLLDIYVF
jgi:uncharacterized membrane protein YfcA